MSNQDCTTIHEDLRDARALLEQSGSGEEKKKYRKAAELILLKTLRLDPNNDEAKILLQSARALQSGQAVPPPIKKALPPPPKAEEELPFVAAPALFDISG